MSNVSAIYQKKKNDVTKVLDLAHAYRYVQELNSLTNLAFVGNEGKCFKYTLQLFLL
jgi:hypothetical protein